MAGTQFSFPAGWSLTGNSGTTATNFIGTKDNADVVVKRNNIETGRFPTYGFSTNAINAGQSNTLGGSTNQIVGSGHVTNVSAQFGGIFGGYGNTSNSTAYVYGVFGGAGINMYGTNSASLGGSGTYIYGTRSVAINGNGSFIASGAVDCVSIGGSSIDGVSKAFAIGTNAYCQHSGTMILGDSQTTGYLTSTTTDQFSAKFANGYRFNLAYNVQAMEILPTGRLKLYSVPTYADNAAAIAAGLTTGETYKTSTGQLNIVY